MNANDELSRRLAATAEAIDTEPDLGDVIARSGKRRNRSRQMAAAGATAVVLAGLGALGLASSRNNPTMTDTPAPMESAAPSASDAPTTSDTETITSGPPGTLADQPATSSSAPPAQESAPFEVPQLSDPADPFLDQTTVVFDRVLDDGLPLVARVSDVSYGELFDIEWTAPTGSVEACLSGPALMVGDPSGESESWNEQSVWAAFSLVPLSPARPTDVTQAALPGRSFFSNESVTSVFIVRTQLPVTEVTVQGTGVSAETATFVDGIAALEITSVLVPVEPGSSTQTILFDEADLVMRPAPGSDIDPTLLTVPLSGDDSLGTLPDQCRPPDSGPELPSPGVQPPDPVAAEIAIRDRFALAVDLTIPFDDKPDDLFDSSDGLDAAIERAQAGANAGYVQSAEYDITAIVFTSPVEAWFMYDLEALGVSYHPFGQATLNGDNWQITRDTVCQDLTRAGVFCDVDRPTEPVTPPVDPAAPPTTVLTQEQVATYEESLFCNPLRSC